MNLRVDPSSAGDGGVSLKVTLLAGGGLEGQATVAINIFIYGWIEREREREREREKLL